MGGGRDLNLRTLRADGVTLAGHFLGVDGHEACFAADLYESVAWGDERYRDFAGLVGRTVAERGLGVPEAEEPPRFAGDGPERIDVRGLAAVLYTTGFRPDYRSWLDWPGAFDEHGFPIHDEGESVAQPGVFFVGVHFLRKRKSALLIGVGEDAALGAAGRGSARRLARAARSRAASYSIGAMSTGRRREVMERMRERLAHVDADQGWLFAAIAGQVQGRRHALGLSQAELAELTGTTQSAIARLESGGRPPRIDTLLRIANALDCELAIELRPRTDATGDDQPE